MSEALLKSIQLITFDVFGTVVDWANYVKERYQEGYEGFIEASHPLQRTGTPTVPYRKLLEQVFAQLQPTDRSNGARQDAEHFGQSQPYQDSRALSLLQLSCPIGTLSNSDYRHQFDVQRSLGLQWDVVSLAESVGAYKPTDEAWDRMIADVQSRLNVAKENWLHVTAYTDYDLIPAQQRGLRTCFIERPHGSPRTEAMALPTDLCFDDLWQLQNAFVRAQGQPIVYTVRAHAQTVDQIARFSEWMQKEHGWDLLQVEGCRDFRCYRHDERTAECRYVFQSAASLEDYLNRVAPEMRQRIGDAFAPGELEFKRGQCQLLAAGRHV